MTIFEQQHNEFIGRHIGPNQAETDAMLKTIGAKSMEELIAKQYQQVFVYDNP